ncbi:hypothetical protein A2954_04585 [Candidatus Roizmanbacteria bacterium RIFCSPLOWO2_01_FULL_37_12]|uniref:DUF2283 domain-containing protein n=1 Tax=Candidatus Roizmanbacteria bacterium RIFCSPLOWO2_01_FULL_37_12 TaxID=1802056 RepID=A0A1F7IFW6_9BACT|nr:MAG: hypothetical protein A2954_04585 [Candidatus Roizmanbacteria bacterium RIFCSPLOWO2_01_FULL_37_12]
MKTKIEYEKKDDVLMIWFSQKKIDFAEQEGDAIMHFSKKNEPVLLEILDASKFLKETSKTLPLQVKQQIFSS